MLKFFSLFIFIFLSHSPYISQAALSWKR